jgi:hypothetical protein
LGIYLDGGAQRWDAGVEAHAVESQVQDGEVGRAPEVADLLHTVVARVQAPQTRQPQVRYLPGLGFRV